MPSTPKKTPMYHDRATRLVKRRTPLIGRPKRHRLVCKSSAAGNCAMLRPIQRLWSSHIRYTTTVSNLYAGSVPHVRTSHLARFATCQPLVVQACSCSSSVRLLPLMRDTWRLLYSCCLLRYWALRQLPHLSSAAAQLDQPGQSLLRSFVYRHRIQSPLKSAYCNLIFHVARCSFTPLALLDPKQFLFTLIYHYTA